MFDISAGTDGGPRGSESPFPFIPAVYCGHCAAFDQNHEISFSGNLICVSSAGYSICIYFDLLFGHVYGEICQAVSLFRLKKDL